MVAFKGIVYSLAMFYTFIMPSARLELSIFQKRTIATQGVAYRQYKHLNLKRAGVASESSFQRTQKIQFSTSNFLVTTVHCYIAIYFFSGQEILRFCFHTVLSPHVKFVYKGRIMMHGKICFNCLIFLIKLLEILFISLSNNQLFIDLFFLRRILSYLC